MSGYRKQKSNLLLMSLVIGLIMHRLVEFCEKENLNQKCLNKTIRSATRLLTILGSGHSHKLKKLLRRKEATLAPFYFLDPEGRQHWIHYEHFDVFGRFIEHKQKASEFLEDVRIKLLSIADQRFSYKTKRKNALDCIKFFYQLNRRFLHEFIFYEPR